MNKAEIIDSYYRSKNYYPSIPYRPIGQTVVDEVNRMGPDGLYLSTACALIEQESGGKPVFGCDFGPKYTNRPPFCQVEVTKERVKALIKNYYTPPIGGANGVSYCQLTSIGYVEEAERLGGAHLAWANMRVGFRVLNDHIKNLGWPAGGAAYNAGASNWRSVINTYGTSIAKREREWAARLAKADEGNSVPDKVPEWKRTTLVPPNFKKLAPRPGNYQDRHPTRFEWEDRIAALIRRIYQKFPNVTVTTYVEHPEGWGWDTVSFDVWGEKGRNDPIGLERGDKVFYFVYNDPNPPYLEWCIWRRKIRTRANGFRPEPFGNGTVFENHEDHPHFTFQRPFRRLS